MNPILTKLVSASVTCSTILAFSILGESYKVHPVFPVTGGVVLSSVVWYYHGRMDEFNSD